jgi:hypothetical protein
MQQPLVQPTLRTISSGYGQQQQQPVIQPTLKTISSGYGQQQQPSAQMFGQRAFGGY